VSQIPDTFKGTRRIIIRPTEKKQDRQKCEKKYEKKMNISCVEQISQIIFLSFCAIIRSNKNLKTIFESVWNFREFKEKVEKRKELYQTSHFFLSKYLFTT